MKINSRVIQINWILPGLALLALITLLLPAIWNGYPLLFSDSGTYLSSGHGSEIPVDRPIVYGLFVRHVSMSWSVWLVILGQSLLLMPLFPLLFSRVLGVNRPHLYGMLTLIGIALVTGIGVFSSMIMADIFTGAMIISFILLKEGKSLRYIELIFLSVLVVFAATVHLSHFALLLALIIISIGADFIRIRSRPFPWKKNLLLVTLALSAVLLLCSINASHGLGFKMTRTRYVVLVSSLIDKDILHEYFMNHPGPEPSGLYRSVDRIPENGWEFLWNDSSPLYDSLTDGKTWADCWTEGEPGYKSLTMLIMADQVSRRMFFKKSVQFSLEQMKRFDLGSLVAQDSSSYIFQAVEKLYPFDVNFYTHSEQWHRTLEYRIISRVQRWAVYLSLAIILMSLFRFRRIPLVVWKTGIILAGAYVANAVITATLATVDERYQARIVWIIPLFAILLIISILNPKLSTN